jgi:hypothetical protein
MHECSMGRRKVVECDEGIRVGWRDLSGMEELEWDGGIRAG